MNRQPRALIGALILALGVLAIFAARAACVPPLPMQAPPGCMAWHRSHIPHQVTA